MNDIQLFANDEFELHLTQVGDSYQVQAPGLARSLAFHSAKDMLRTVPDEEKGWETAPTLGGDQEMWHVTEAGFYRVLGQRQAARIKDPKVRSMVERFQSWVFGVVLPALRRGELVAPQRPVLPQDLPSALRALADEMEAHGETRQALEEERPLAEAYRDLMDADGTFDWAAVAQIFSKLTGGLGRNNFLELLRSDDVKVLKANNTPYQFPGLDRFFKVAPTKGGKQAEAITRVTPEGLDWLRKRLIKHFNFQPGLFPMGETQ